MSTPPQPPAPPAPPTSPPPQPPAPQPDPPTTQAVPYDRFKEVNEAKSAAERERDEMRQRLQALEDEKKSDLDKATARAERAEAKVGELSTQIANSTRDRLVGQFAKTANAIDEDAVVAMVATGQFGNIDVNDPGTIKAAVDKLAEQKPTLFGAAQQQQPMPFGLPNGTAPVPGAQPEPSSERESMGRSMLAILRPGA